MNAWRVLFVASFVLVPARAAFLPEDTPAKPNVIFILADDLAQGDLGSYGQKKIKTPHLDRMAAEGLRFTQAYSGTSVCAPSRASLMTGLHMGHCPIRANREVQPEGQRPLPEGAYTVARLFRDHGYATGCVGKWGMGMFDSPGSPLKVGFDHFFGYNCQRHAHSYFPAFLYRDDKSFDLDGKTYAQNLIADDALAWVKANKDRPFFLYYPVTLPHGKYEIDDLGDYARTDWTPQQKTYAAMVTRLDRDVGRLLAQLKDLGLDEKTLVVFAGDNGSAFGPESPNGKFFAQANGLRGFKRGLYEGGLRQACLARWPGVVPAGKVSDAPWAFWDFLPTCADLLGVRLPEKVRTDGVSVVPILKGGVAPKRECFYWELHEQNVSRQAVRFGDWKAVKNGPSAATELYDLKADPGETKDLAAMNKEMLAKAEGLLRSSREEHPDWPLKDAPKPGGAAATKPNVLVILADDLGYSDLGCYGGEIQTPHLDGLAANGLRFTQFYNGTRCCPTRASLITGLYPHQAGVGNMTGDQKLPGYRGSLQPNTATLAEVLGSAGYRTYLCGKWHLASGPGQTPKPTERGFDDYFGLVGGFHGFWDAKAYVRLPAGRPTRTYEAGKFHATDAFTDYALDFLADARKTPERPFFLYLTYTAPHFPLHAHAEDIARYKVTYKDGWDRLRADRHKRMIDLGLIAKDTPLSPRSPYETRRDFARTGDNPAWDSLDADRRADLARRMAVYAAMVDRMDRNVGRVIDDLKKNGQLDDTLILFLSDNGACAEWDPHGFDVNSGPRNVLHAAADLDKMGQPGTYHSYGSGWANACNTPFRLYKHYCHEGGIRTPLIAHWPKGIADKGKFRTQPGHMIDVMATLVDVSGATYPTKRGDHAVAPMEGTSLLPAFADKPLARERLAWEHEGNAAIRVGDWKLVRRHNQPWELYDLASDPVELTDLAGKQAERVKDLAGQWETWAKRTQVLPAP